MSACLHHDVSVRRKWKKIENYSVKLVTDWNQSNRSRWASNSDLGQVISKKTGSLKTIHDPVLYNVLAVRGLNHPSIIFINFMLFVVSLACPAFQLMSVLQSFLNNILLEVINTKQDKYEDVFNQKCFWIKKDHIKSEDLIDKKIIQHVDGPIENRANSS